MSHGSDPAFAQRADGVGGWQAGGEASGGGRGVGHLTPDDATRLRASANKALTQREQGANHNANTTLYLFASSRAFRSSHDVPSVIHFAAASPFR